MNWKEVLQRPDIEGGSLQTEEGGYTYWGPIAKIEQVEEEIVITSPWVARRIQNGWEKHPITKCSFEAKSSPPSDGGTEAGKKTIFFLMPSGIGIIHPKGGRKLNLREVKEPAL